MKKGLVLILLISVYSIAVSFLFTDPASVVAFKPIGPTGAAPAQPLEQQQLQQPGMTQESPLSLSASSSFLDYRNFTFGMGIKYPSNWTKYESHDGSSTLIVQFTDQPVANGYGQNTWLGVLNITGTPITLNSSTNDLSLLLHERLNYLMALPSFKLIETKMITINEHQQNIPATMTLYSYRDPLHYEVYVLMVDILRDGRHYTLKYSAEPEKYFKSRPVLLQMIDSFDITEVPNTTMVIPASTNFNTYENSTMRISIEYPENWIYEEEADYVTFHFPGGHLRVGVSPSPFSSSQEAAINFRNNAINDLSGFNLILFEPIDLRGVNFTSSNLLVYTQNSIFGSIYKVTEINTVFGGREYLIRYVADPAVYPIVEPTTQKMIDSFQITG